MSMKNILEDFRSRMLETNVALAGMKHEEVTAANMNSFFEATGLPYTARAAGGAGHGSDVVVSDAESGAPVTTYEVKTSKGSRIDFGQFRLAYSGGEGWVQATGQNNPIVREMFQQIKPTLDNEVVGIFPPGPKLNNETAMEFWNAYEPGRTRSLSGDVVRVPVAENLIQDYYATKGDEYIILGDDVFSLKDNLEIPSLSSGLKESYIVFRIKYHTKTKDGNRSFSYTATLRGKFLNSSKTDLPIALGKIYNPEQ